MQRGERKELQDERPKRSRGAGGERGGWSRGQGTPGIAKDKSWLVNMSIGLSMIIKTF